MIQQLVYNNGATSIRLDASDLGLALLFAMVGVGGAVRYSLISQDRLYWETGDGELREGAFLRIVTPTAGSGGAAPTGSYLIVVEEP